MFSLSCFSSVNFKKFFINLCYYFQTNVTKQKLFFLLSLNANSVNECFNKEKYIDPYYAYIISWLMKLILIICKKTFDVASRMNSVEFCGVVRSSLELVRLLDKLILGNYFKKHSVTVVDLRILSCDKHRARLEGKPCIVSGSMN